MARIGSLISPLPVFIFATLAFSFAIVGLTSRDWSRRNFYDPGLSPPGFRSPIYSEYRSPFKICTIYGDVNNASIFHEDCKTFRAYGSFGSNQTSCELLNITGSADSSNTGDQRLCQQIHYAGNLSITSLSFVTLGFVLTLIMTVLALVNSRSASASAPADPSEEAAKEEAQPEAAAATTYDNHTHSHTHTTSHHRHPQQQDSNKPSYTPYLNLLLILSFSIGALAAFISQFYGIIGFIQSQPNNGAFAASPGDVNDPRAPFNNNHGPWYQGKALKYWVTMTWIFGALAAGAAAMVWRLPRVVKDI